MLEVLIFVLCLVILIILVASILILIYFYDTGKEYLLDTLSGITNILPNNSNFEYTNIDYALIDENKLIPQLKYLKDINIDLSTLLTFINMTSYNLYGDYKVHLPNYIEYVGNLSNCGYIYKIQTPKHINNINNAYILSYRGTRTTEELIHDFDSIQVPFDLINKKSKVHRGFYRLWKDNLSELDDFIKTLKPYDILISTGHSLGGNNAILSALYIKHKIQGLSIHLETFATPRIGDHEFINLLNLTIPNNYIHINLPDIVHTLPPMTLTTIGDTYYYENYNNVIMHDIQMGTISKNHRLDTYLKSINDKYNYQVDPIWFKNFKLFNYIL